MSYFNLIDEAWLPIRFPDGHRKEMGIREVFHQAQEIAEIEDPSPLVVAALHRFLLAVLYRALEGPSSIDEAHALFVNGLPIDKIDLYLDKWHERFWLFHDKYPFGQVKILPKDMKQTTEYWMKLAPERKISLGNLLFDHTLPNDMYCPSYKSLSQWLITANSFSTCGGRGYSPSPSANSVLCIPIGNNLSDTLLLNLVPYESPKLCSLDSALWERDIDFSTPPKCRIITGYSDLYSWRTRLIQFPPPKTFMKTREITFMAGDKWDKATQDNLSGDPMSATIRHPNRGNSALRFSSETIWRNFDSLIPTFQEKHISAPMVLNNALLLSKKTKERFPTTVLILGQSYVSGQDKINFWRMERFAFPTALASDRDVRQEINNLLAEAETAHKNLWVGCLSYAEDILTRSGGRSPHKKDINSFIQQLPISGRYWSILEGKFHEILSDYTEQKEPDDIERDWLIAVRNALNTAWDEHAAAVGTVDTWTMRALIRAKGKMNKTLKELSAKIRILSE